MDRLNQAFMALEGRTLDKDPKPGRKDRPGYWFGSRTPALLRGIMLGIRESRVVAVASGLAGEDSRKIAQVLNGALYLEGSRSTVDGRDCHFLVKLGMAEPELLPLGVTGGRKSLDNGLNITITGRSRRGLIIEIHSAAMSVSIRYGLGAEVLERERARLAEEAHARAVARAWAREVQRAREGRERDGGRVWAEGERQELLSTGKVSGYDGYYILPVEQYPELADSSTNIQFLRQNEAGRR